MFQTLIPPILRSTRLFVTACGIMHPRCCRPVAWKRRNSASRLLAGIEMGAFYHKLQHRLVVLKIGGINARNPLR